MFIGIFRRETLNPVCKNWFFLNQVLTVLIQSLMPNEPHPRLPALTCTSLLMTLPTLLWAAHRYTVLWISWRYPSAVNGSSTKEPFRSTRRTPGMSEMLWPSPDSQSMAGGGLPEAEQSSHPPVELLNSNLDGGSIRKLGPLICPKSPATRDSKISGTNGNLLLSLVYRPSASY